MSMQSTTSFTKSYSKKLPLGLLALILLFIGALFLFGYLVHEVLWEKEEAVDYYIFRFFSAHIIHQGLTPFMKGVTYFASATFLQIAYGLIFLSYLLRKDFKRALEIGAIGVGGFLINYFMKISFHRVRPPHPLIEPLQNFSFPSGHATSSFIFYGLLTYLVWKTRIPKLYKYLISTILILFALLIGFSRVYLRVHYPSDVAAGFCIGLAWLCLCIWLMERLKKKTDKEVMKV
jgi:membrane-associated phospholipid phosphatase